VTDVLGHVAPSLVQAGPLTASEIRATGIRIGPGEELAALKQELESFLYDHVYRHPRLILVRSHAQNRLREMFEIYFRHPDRLPPWHRARAETVGLARAVGDYLAGMTDRFCDQQYQALTSL
jgi:dGTPase